MSRNTERLRKWQLGTSESGVKVAMKIGRLMSFKKPQSGDCPSLTSAEERRIITIEADPVDF